MDKKQIIVRITLIVLGVLFVLSAYIAYDVFTSALGQPLSLAVAAVTPTAAKPAAQEKAAPQAQGVCSTTGTTLMLLVGADFSMGVWPYGADAVRLVKLDFDTPGITVVAFPRDLVLDTVAMRDPEHVTTPLGLSYHYTKLATQGTEDEKILAATNLVAQVLYDNFAVQSEHYFTLQLDSVGAMIDEVGGLDIEVAETVTDKKGVTFNPGQQNMNGRLSIEFVRILEDEDGEMGRLKRQEVFIKALQKKAIQADTITHMPALIEQFNEAIVTDLSPEILLNYACLLNSVPGKDAEFYEIHGQLVKVGEDGEMLPETDKIKAFLSEVFEP
jgi:LCP family protein required for cell wall assembly